MEDAVLEMREEKFENAADHAADAKTLFFVESVQAGFKTDLKVGEETEKIEVIRWQLRLLHGMLWSAYSAHGLTLDGGVLVDLRRAGGLDNADWWLAASHLCRADTWPRIEESHLTGLHRASGGSFALRSTDLPATTD